MTSRASISGRRRSCVAALLGLFLLMLAGCSGGGATPGASDAPAPSNTSASPPGSQSASPTPTAVYKPADASGKAENVPVPELPEAAKAETKEGLEAFARYWFSQLNFAYETGHLAGLESVTSPNCEFCSNISRSLAKNYESGRWLAGGRIETPSITTTYETQSDGQYQVVVQVRQAMISYFEPGGTEFRAATAPSDTGNVMLVGFRNGAWQLTGLHPIR